VNLVSNRYLRARCLAYVSFAALMPALAPCLLAHTELVSATPAANSTVSAPKDVTIKFSGALEAKFSKITVTDASAQVVTKGASTIGEDAKSMTVLLPALAPGVYTVQWVAVSTDSHRSQGQYKFTVK
jgi:copper resistance protein C